MSATAELNVQDILCAESLDFEAIQALYARVRQFRALQIEVRDLLGKLGKLSLPDARLAAAYWMLGEKENARQHAQKESKAVTALLIQGALAEDAGDFETALDFYKKAETLAPSLSPCVLRQLSAMRKLGKIDEALARIAKLEREFGDKPNLFFHKGRCFEDEGQQQNALDCYNMALELDPNHAESAFRAALICDLRGLEAEARELYTKVGPGSITAFTNACLNMALAYEDNDQYSEAIRCCEAVLRMNPNNIRAKSFLDAAENSMNMYYSPEETKQSERLEAVLRIPVTDFELSVRSRNCLAKMNIRTLGDLVKKTESEMLAYKNFGETSLREIREILSSKNLRLGMMREDAATRAAFGRSTGRVQEELLSKSIDEIELSVRSRKCMEGLGIKSLNDLVSKSEAELAGAKNFGRVSLNEIKKRIHEMGLSLRDGK